LEWVGGEIAVLLHKPGLSAHDLVQAQVPSHRSRTLRPGISAEHFALSMNPVVKDKNELLR
jgi:hypothetical protein